MEITEKLYSVVMDEEELALFSDFQERLFFYDKSSGQYFTGEDMAKTGRDYKLDTGYSSDTRLNYVNTASSKAQSSARKNAERLERRRLGKLVGPDNYKFPNGSTIKLSPNLKDFKESIERVGENARHNAYVSSFKSNEHVLHPQIKLGGFLGKLKKIAKRIK